MIEPMAAVAHPSVPHLEFELAFAAEGHQRIAGLDEVGRGALAGPVAAGAVILPIERGDLADVLYGVRDSKMCSPASREELDACIREVAISAAVGMASQDEIDAMGIAAAARLAMRRALDALSARPHALLIDWVRLRDVNLPQRSMAKGDQQCLSIAAASIIAKVARDQLMVELDEQYPAYGFAQHKGYATPAHQAAIETF